MENIKPPHVLRGTVFSFHFLSLLLFLAIVFLSSQFVILYRANALETRDHSECVRDLGMTRKLVDSDKLVKSCECSSSIHLLIECYEELNEVE